MCISAECYTLQGQLCSPFANIFFSSLVLYILLNDISPQRDLMQHHSPAAPAATRQTGAISDSCNLCCCQSASLMQSISKFIFFARPFQS